MSKRAYKHFLKDISDSCRKIREYTKGMDIHSFTSDEKTFDAVIRNFEIIGEAANKLPQEIKSKYSEIPWRDMVDFRNRITHEYFGISAEIVWNIIVNELPGVEEEINKIED